MDLLIDSSRSDRVSEFLRIFRVRSTIYCRSVMSAPWGFRVKGSAIASFHLLISGNAWLEVDGAEPRRLAEGDLVVLPHGDDHQLRDDLASEIEYLDDILDRSPPVEGRLEYGGGGASSHIICGGFAIEDPAMRPFLEDLPRVLHVESRDETTGLAAPAAGILEALSAHPLGTPALANRLAELLLTHAIGQYAALSPEASWLAAINEPSIAAAIKLIHQEPERPWVVGELAQRVGMSRSSFAERFRVVTGEGPMTYVRKCRLGRVARYLATTNWGLVYIARRSGYESDVSLSKAFKRQFGLSPRDYRIAAQEASNRVPEDATS
jgi:AraC-like DNA-binding protein